MLTMPLIISSRDQNFLDSETKKILDSNSPHEVFETQDSGIEDVRQWIAWLDIKASNQSKKILIIKNAQELSVEAQNALLKTLEEPPINAIIVLQSQQSENLLATIVSRCCVISHDNYIAPEDPEVAKQINDLESKNIFALDLASGFKERQETLEWLDKATIITRKTLSSNPLNYGRLQAVLKAKKMLLENTNVRLTLENLFLNW